MSSCNEEKPDSQVRITVKDASGNPVVNATVRLEGQPSDSVYVDRLSLYDLEQKTGSTGIAVFVFNDFYDQGDNGFAVLNVEATDGSITTTGHVKVVEDETVEQTIVLQ